MTHNKKNMNERASKIGRTGRERFYKVDPKIKSIENKGLQSDLEQKRETITHVVAWKIGIAW